MGREEKVDEIERIKHRRMPVGDKWRAAEKIWVPEGGYSLFQKPEPKEPPDIYVMREIKKNRMAENHLPIE